MAINGLLYESGVYATTGDLAVAGGLVYITGSTFSASSAVNVNNCFSSTYENYRVVVSFTSAVGGVRLPCDYGQVGLMTPARTTTSSAVASARRLI